MFDGLCSVKKCRHKAPFKVSFMFNFDRGSRWFGWLLFLCQAQAIGRALGPGDDVEISVAKTALPGNDVR